MVKRLAQWLLQTVLLLYVFILALLIVPGFMGIHVETVTSGSMEPAICTGAVIYVKQAAFDAIEEGDIITYVIDGENTKVTHRVVGIDIEKQRFWTKGDANHRQDAKPVPMQNVIGIVVYTIPFLGKAAMLLTGMRGKAALVFLLLMLAILDSAINVATPRKSGGRH